MNGIVMRVVRPMRGATRRALLTGAVGLVATLGHRRRLAHAAPEPFDDAVLTARRTLDLPQLEYPGQWNPRPNVMRELAVLLRTRTRLEPVSVPRTVQATSSDLFRTPFLYVAGTGTMPNLGEAAEARLRRFVDLGGMLVFDSADGGTDRGFERGVEALLDRISPSARLAPVSPEHVLYRSYYLVEFPSGRTETFDHVLGVQEEGRLKVLLLRNDLGGALSTDDADNYRYPCTPGGSVQRERARRFGVNILMYATCTDYKADRAHVETLMRRRRWR